MIFSFCFFYSYLLFLCRITRLDLHCRCSVLVKVLGLKPCATHDADSAPDPPFKPFSLNPCGIEV